MQSNWSFDTDTQVRPLPSVAPGSRAGQVQRLDRLKRVPNLMNLEPANADHPDALTYRRAADAFRRKDLEAITETIYEDVTWHFPGRSWMAREVQGRDALLACLKEIITRTGQTFTLEDRFISGTDHHLVALQRFGATHNGCTKKFEATSVMRSYG